MNFQNIILIALFSTLFAGIGCSKKSSSSPHSESTTFGTGDGAGGNGSNNKVYERYAIDPTKQKSYIDRLEPLMLKLNEVYKDPSLSEQDQMNFAAYFYLHTWYVLDINLSPIDKKVLGITFTSDKTQQIAVQTDREVWIDAKAYDKMTDEDKAGLLLHEFVMSLYLTKFQPLSDFCVESDSESDSAGCDNANEIDQAMGIDPTHVLDEDDYKNVRQMTTFLLNVAQSGDTSQVRKMFSDLKFDPRIWGNQGPANTDSGTIDPQSNENSDGSLELTNNSLLELLDTAKFTNQGLTQCKAIQLGLDFGCSTEYQSGTVSMGGVVLPSLQLSLQKTGGQSFNALPSAQFSQTYLSKVVNPNASNKTYYAGLVQAVPRESYKQGDMIRMTYIVVRKEKSINGSESLKIAAIYSVPFVLTKVDLVNQNCTLMNPKATTLDEDIIVAYEQGFPLSYFALIAKISLPMCF